MCVDIDVCLYTKPEENKSIASQDLIWIQTELGCAKHIRKKNKHWDSHSESAT